MKKILLTLVMTTFFQFSVHAKAPVLGFFTTDNPTNINSRSECLDYAENLSDNLGMEIIKKGESSIFFDRGNTRLVIGCLDSALTLALASLSSENDEGECVFNTVVTLVKTANTGAGLTIDCPLSPSLKNEISEVSPNLNIHIPQAVYESTNLWINLRSVPATNGRLLWELSNYGVNK